MRALLLAILLPSLAVAAIGGATDSVDMYGLSVGNVAPLRTMVAGFIARSALGGLADSSRGRWSGSGTSYGGMHYSTTTTNNDWLATDFEGDVYWFQDVFDSLLKDCLGLATLDTQYISRVDFRIVLTTRTGTTAGILAKMQGPVLIRPKPVNLASGSGAGFGGRADSAACYNRLKIVSGDTTYWRQKTFGPERYDTISKIGGASGDYEQIISTAGPDTSRYELGLYSTNGDVSTHSPPTTFDFNGVTVGNVAAIDITPMFKAAMVACAAAPTTMRNEGFGILINWVTSTSQTLDVLNATYTDTWIRLAVHGITPAASMTLRIVTKTNIDNLCANKAMDAGNFKYPWYRRAGPVPGQLRGDRNSIKKPGARRKRPPQ